MELIKYSLNKVLYSLILILVEFGTDTTKFVKALRSKRMCQYQSKLLKKYLRKPNKRLSLVVDALSFTVHYKADATKFINRLTDTEKGLVNVPTKLAGIIHVDQVTKMGKINYKFSRYKKKQKHRPFYNIKWVISLASEPESEVQIFLSDGEKIGSTKGLRVEFNPNRFNDYQLAAVFYHLYQVLGGREYAKFVRNAYVTRLDTAVNLPGIAHFFLFFLPMHGNSSASSCFYGDKSNDLEGVCETLYLGRMNDPSSDKVGSLSSVYRIYCSTLAKLKNSYEALDLPEVVNTRLEHQFIPHSERAELKLSELDSHDTKLAKLKIVNPICLHLLTAEEHGDLLLDRTFENIRRNGSTLNAAMEKKGVSTLSLDSRWVKKAQERELGLLRQILIEPKVMFRRFDNEL